MGIGTTSGPAGTSRVPDVAAVLVFLLGLVGWLLALPCVALVLREWAIYPDAGDAAIGLLVLGPLVLLVGLVLLVAAVALSLWARRLPRWFRAITIASPALGCLVGLAILYRALAG